MYIHIYIWRQTIIWNNAGLLSIGHLGIKLCEIAAIRPGGGGGGGGRVKAVPAI